MFAIERINEVPKNRETQAQSLKTQFWPSFLKTSCCKDSRQEKNRWIVERNSDFAKVFAIERNNEVPRNRETQAQNLKNTVRCIIGLPALMGPYYTLRPNAEPRLEGANAIAGKVALPT